MITLDGNLLGHREDAIAMKFGNSNLVVNIDGWVESTDRPEGMTARQVGYRAVANAVSDILVKGAKPVGMVISSTISEHHKDELKEIIRGFKEASTNFEVPFFGGDMNSGNDLVIDVTVWGVADRLVARKNAQVGDSIYWLGPPLGCTAAALGILTKNWQGSKQRALEVMGNPQLYPEFRSIEASSATDSSDGLARSLYHLANGSNKRFDIDFDDITPEKWIENIAERQNIPLETLFLYGGEELGVVFTYQPEESNQNPENLLNCIRIGTVREGSGVYLENKLIDNQGWDHFTTHSK